MTLPVFMDFIRRADHAYAVSCRPVMEEFGLSKTSFDILMFLANNPSHRTAKEISSMRNIKANVVSVHVDRLVGEGYLSRQSVPEDRRKIRLVCTKKADVIIRRGREAQKEFYDRLLQGLTAQDLDAFKHCFEVILSNAAGMPSDSVSAGKSGR